VTKFQKSLVRVPLYTVIGNPNTIFRVKQIDNDYYYFLLVYLFKDCVKSKKNKCVLDSHIIFYLLISNFLID
jgi:hypothetical protein